MLATDTTLGGRYRLGSIIGRGGGAEVFRAEDLTTGRPVAVKVLRAVSPSDLQRFEQEGKTLARLDHPAIVRMCDDGDHEGVPYLVLDLVDGEPLSTRLHEGPMDEDAVARMGVVLADALAHAHDIGVVHRDVKPGNVLFDQDGGVHLTDFGIARLTDMTAITATGLVIGTAAYLAPEQVKGDGASPASDIYALGLVLLEALTGERAYDGSPSEAAVARLHRSPEIPRTRSHALGVLLAAMTESEPTRRPSAVAAALALTPEALHPAADATAVLPIASDATAAIPVPAPRSRAIDVRRYRVPLVAAAFAALLFLLTSLFGSSGVITVPATAQTPTTATPTSSPATLVAQTVPSTTAPRHKGKDKQGGGGD